MRVKVDYRTTQRDVYIDFCKYHPNITLTFDQWRSLLYAFNESFRDYILETGEKAKLPFGFGDISINKQKRQKTKTIQGKTYVNLPIDWKKTLEKGKKIYNFNFHTEGWFFGWVWFRDSARFKNTDFWHFKASRITSRLLAHYLKTKDSYQHIYREWIPKHVYTPPK